MKRALLITLISLRTMQAGALEWKAAWDTLLGREQTRQTDTGESPKTHAAPDKVIDVNLGTGVYRVTGRGAAPASAESVGQARLMAIGAAKLDALQQLAAILQGARLRSENTAANYQQTDFKITEETQAFLKGTRVIATRVKPDGTAEVDVELALVSSQHTVDFMSLDGYRIQVESPLEPAAPAAPSPAPGFSAGPVIVTPPSQNAGPPEAQAENVASPDEGEPYTDVIIDARGLAVQPSLSPKAYVSGGLTLYPFEDGILRDKAPKKSPPIEYVYSIGEAYDLEGFGGKPLALRATDVRSNGADIILPMAEARKLKLLGNSRLMQGEGYIIVLIDEPARETAKR